MCVHVETTHSFYSDVCSHFAFTAIFKFQKYTHVHDREKTCEYKPAIDRQRSRFLQVQCTELVLFVS